MPNANQTYDVVIKKYSPMEIIVSEGSSEDCFFVILDGSVEVTQNQKAIRTLQQGDVFGIENYYRKHPYTTTARAITPARVAAYRFETIRDILFTSPLVAEQIVASVMRQLEQTTGMVEENIPYEITNPIREHTYQDGEIIFAENTTGSELYRVLEAQHGLSVSIEGSEIRTITRMAEVFGVSSALLQQPRSATVTSIGRSLIQIFSVENLEEDFANNPGLAMAIIKSLSSRLRAVDRQSAGQTKKTPGTINKSGSTF